MDLIELDIVDFDMIFEIDWFHSCNASFDYKTLKFSFHFANEPVI